MGFAFLILCSVAVLLVLTIFELSQQHEGQHKRLETDLQFKLDELKEEIITALEDRLEEMSMSNQEKEAQAFLGAPDLNWAFESLWTCGFARS